LEAVAGRAVGCTVRLYDDTPPPHALPKPVARRLVVWLLRFASEETWCGGPVLQYALVRAAKREGTRTAT
jgi:hypothetical protein